MGEDGRVGVVLTRYPVSEPYPSRGVRVVCRSLDSGRMETLVEVRE